MLLLVAVVVLWEDEDKCVLFILNVSMLSIDGDDDVVEVHGKACCGSPNGIVLSSSCGPNSCFCRCFGVIGRIVGAASS